MPKLDLSIIIVSYNTQKVLLDCLRSVIKHTTAINYEVIVVDNGSSDGSLEAVKLLSHQHPQIVAIDAGQNLGFGRGNNLGVEKAKGECLLFLNSDTLVFDNTIQESFLRLKKEPSTGIFSCQLLNADKTIQPSGGFFPSLWNVFAWQFFIDDLPLLGRLINSFHPHAQAYHSDITLDWLTGAYLMIRKDLFKRVGGFDKHIFMYTEEMELAYRLRKIGYRTVLDRSLAIIHLGGASAGSVLALTSEIKYMIYFWQKHKPRWQLPLLKTFFFFGSLLRLLIFGIIRGDATARKTYEQALKLTI